MSEHLGTYSNGRWAAPTMAGMAQTVADEYGITVAALKGDRQRRWETIPRHDLMYRIYATGRFSLPQIGRFLGGRNHTTVGHGIAAHCRREDIENPLRSFYARVHG